MNHPTLAASTFMPAGESAAKMTVMICIAVK
jgi:hypothetical protein